LERAWRGLRGMEKRVKQWLGRVGGSDVVTEVEGMRVDIMKLLPSNQRVRIHGINFLKDVLDAGMLHSS